MRTLCSVLLLILGMVLSHPPAWGQFPAPCDQDRSCVGNAITTEITSGKGAQYVDVDSSYRVRAISTAITFEAWIRPTEQAGKRQFIGGLWGPNTDDNDQWVLYIEGTRITFALSADGTRLGDLDNTVATIDLPDLYTRGWLHVAAVWDGGSAIARLYVDGFERTTATNAGYPVTKLHPVPNRSLLMQIGSCNGLYDDPARFRTFLGQIDEVRLWDRALAPNEIRCQRDRALAGNETGLILYYRCNEASGTQTLCDATGHRIIGKMRSGARCEGSDRVIPITYTMTPASSSAALNCTSDTTLSFSITDTSYCGSQVSMRIIGRDAGIFTLSTGSLTLTQNTPRAFTVAMKAMITGSIEADIEVTSAGGCGTPLIVPLRFTRKTELEYSEGRIELDTLYVGCVERPYEEKTLTITNGTGRSMTINSAALGDTIFTWRPADPTRPLPATLPPGGTWSITLRMKADDTTRTRYDTLRVLSDDRCPGSGIIPVQGHTQDVLLLLREDGFGTIDSMNFEDVCPNQISNVQLYQYRSGVNEPIQVDIIEFDEGFFGRRNVYPIGLLPQTAYQATFVRFKPTRPGPFAGEMRVRTRYRGCTIVKKIYLTGRGIDVDYGYDRGLIGFGNVTVGKASQQSVNIINRGDPRRLSAYLKIGDVFRIVSPRSFSLGKGESSTITVEFRPREAITYVDTLCVFDEQCYSTQCIPIDGTGVFDALSFTPSYLSFSNVIGCVCKVDSVVVRNITSAPITFTSGTLNDPTGKFTLVSGPASGTIPPNGTVTYVVRYCPADLDDDRADQAFIDLDLADGQTYQVLIRGTSTVPKIYVTPLTTYGNVEVGWTRADKILIENISTVPLTIDAITPPPGYAVTATSRPIPATLGPRDSIIVDVLFSPTQEIAYDGDLTVTSNSPCAIVQRGRLTGRGIIYRLDVPLSFINYGLIKPCDCAEREIPLPNGSAFKPIIIDSVWIDGRWVNNPNPRIFSWRSRLTGGTTLPYTIPPQGIDTLVVSFCPDIPAVQQNLVADAKLHILSHTADWSREDTVTMSGRREMNFQPNRAVVNFPNIRAGTTSAPMIVELSVPDPFLNPSGDSVVVTGISFSPDQRVFSARAANGSALPWVIRRNEKFQIEITFSPRAPKPYVARMHIRTSFPCDGVDTTVLVRGEGFAFPYGMHIAFDSASAAADTFRLSICDTLVLPVIADREMPQDRIDIAFRIGYDSTIIRLLDVTSPFTAKSTIADTGDGARGYLKDARDVTADTIAWVRFTVLTGDTIFTVHLDEIDFDSDSLVLYKIVVPPDSAVVMISQPRISVTPMTRFDTVNLKSCADRVVTVTNPGRIPIRFDSLSLPPGHRVTASSVPYPVQLDPGDSIHLTITFCPYIELLYDTTISAASNEPCPIVDQGRIWSFGYAPPFPLRFLLDPNIGMVDTVRGTIADTVEVPIIVDRDIPQTPLDVAFDLDYNRRALQFIGLSSPYAATASGIENGGGVRVGIPGCDSIRQGEIARLRFVVAVPDSIVSAMRIAVATRDFTSDSVFWVKLIPVGDTGAVRVDGRCNITRLSFRGGANRLSAPVPNPARELATIEAEFFEDAEATLILYNGIGAEVARLIDGRQRLPGGRYRLEVDTGSLPEGTYFYVLRAGRYTATEQLQVVR